jgi:hypothetical protein
VARVRELTTRAPGAFADAARDPEVAAVGGALPGRLADLISERAKRCLSVLS